jgi:serine/threonine protein kinase
MGGELFSVVRKHSLLPEKAVKFYAGSVLLAFEHMHSRNIIYRDLKPENILLDERGYIKITDLGFAKRLTHADARTFTLCGTPDYLAPEMINGTGHGRGIDWWCLGILIYELVAGQAPFYHRNPLESYKKIKAGSYSFPNHFSAEVRKIISGLLKVKISKRLGTVHGGVDAIKKQPWFKGLKWQKLINKEYAQTPHIPKIADVTDLSNFDDYGEEEQIYYPFQGDQTWCKDF